MTRRSLLLLLLVPILGLAASAQTPAPAKTHRVIFAVTSSDPADWGMTLANIHNLIEGLKPDAVEVEVVAYGPGILLVKNDSVSAEAIAAAQKEGVHFVACQNAMRARHIEPKDLLPGVTPVPAGIVEVVTKQEQGWTYIKGGR